MQAVEDSSTLGDQILAPLGEQPYGVDPIVRAYPGQASIAPGGECREGGVQLVVLAPVAYGEHPHPRRELGWDIHHFFAARGQPVGQSPAQTVGALYGPSPLGEALRPPLQSPQALAVRRELRTLQQFTKLIQCRNGIGRLVRIDPDQHLRLHRPPSGSPPSFDSAWRAYRLWVKAPKTSTYLCRATPPRRASAGACLIRSPAKAFPDHHAAWGHQW